MATVNGGIDKAVYRNSVWVSVRGYDRQSGRIEFADAHKAKARLSKSALRVITSVKEQDGKAVLCHCFGISRDDFLGDSSVKNFVMEQTKAGCCSCETSNPSGRCCLKDFPRRG